MPCCILCWLPASQAVLKRFWRVSAIWCSTAKQWFPECPSLEANNSARKLPLASIPPEIQSRDVAVPCPFSRFAIPPTDRSLAMPLSLARPASEFQNTLVQTAVDLFTNRIVCRVTKIRPARVASGVNRFVFFCRLQAAGYPRWAYFSYPTYYAIGERVHGSLDEPILKFGSWSSKR